VSDVALVTIAITALIALGIATAGTAITLAWLIECLVKTLRKL